MHFLITLVGLALVRWANETSEGGNEGRVSEDTAGNQALDNSDHIENNENRLATFPCRVGSFLNSANKLIY